MRIRLRRPRYQRNVRILLAFALIIPAAGVTQLSGTNPASLFLTVVLTLLAAWSVYDAYRWIAVVTRYGIGIAGVVGTGTTWLAWGEITRVEVEGMVVSLTTRGRAIYQIQIDPRAARFLARMVERQIVGRRPL
ncbi:MAG: hypothetical protein ACOC2D_17390 [Spirochaetota bacterium]